MRTQKQTLELVFRDPSQVKWSRFPKDHTYKRIDPKSHKLINILLSVSKKNFPEFIGELALLKSCTTKTRARRALRLMDKCYIVYLLVQKAFCINALHCVFEILESDLDNNKQLAYNFYGQPCSIHLPQHMKDKLGI